MEESDDFKLAVKVVIKRQMKDLMEQLRERGEEIAVLTVDLEDNSFSHFGSPNGEWFLSQEKNIPQSFLNFCQSNTNQRASQTTVTSISPKKKSIASLRSASKQNTSSSAEVPEVRVTIPKKLAGDLSEDEVAALVGRIVATHLAFQEKGDGSSSGTQFDVLLKAANQSKHKGLSSFLSTPRSSRKRKPTAKFMEGMSSLKKSRKTDDDEFNEMEIGNEEMFGLLSELSNTVLKRVKVTVPNNKTINLEKYSVDTSDSTEALAVYIIQELDAVCGSQLANRNSIKVLVCIDTNVEEVTIVDDNINTARDIKPSLSKLIPVIDIDTDNITHDHDYDDDISNQGDDDEDKSITNVEYKKFNLVKRERAKPGKRRWNDLQRCPICGKLIHRTNNLSAHIRRVHMREKKFICKVCSAAFFDSCSLNTHTLGVHTRQCFDCGHHVVEKERWDSNTTRFSTRYLRCQCGSEINMKAVSGRKRGYEYGSVKVIDADFTQFACEVCGKLFSQRGSWERHLKTHLDGTQTSVNDSIFGTQPSFREIKADIDKIDTHDDGDSDMEKDLPDNDTNNVDNGSDTEKASATPEAPKKKSWKLQHACPICGKMIFRTNNLNAHIRRVHMNDRRHNCDICSKNFFISSEISTHKLSVHTKKCSDCGEYVMEKEPWKSGTDNLTQRFVKCKCGSDVNMSSVVGRKKVTEDRELKRPGFRQYVCEYCGRIFSQKNKCVRHTKIHTGEKDYKCDLCDVEYARKTSLRDHRASVHNILDHQCDICLEKFKSKRELETHMDTHSSPSYDDQQQIIVYAEETASGTNDQGTTTSTISATESTSETCTVLVNDATCDIVEGLEHYPKDTIFIIESYDATQ